MGQPSSDRFRRFAMFVSDSVGSPLAFNLALLVVAVWAATGPFFHFGDTWQLVINTGTTIVTFLMIFLVQATQNRDARAIHLKLNELIRSQSRARDRFAELENASDEELTALQDESRRLHEQATHALEARRKHPGA